MFPILPDLARILASQRAKNQYTSPELGSDWSWDWGWRIHPIDKTKKWHNGIDLPAPTGTPIYAPMGGVVSHVSYDDTSGNYIKINHDGKEGIQETAYVHLSRTDVSPGDVVVEGQKIGEVGSTGASTGPHLHFIIRPVGGTYSGGQQRRDSDPLPHLEASLEKKIAGMGISGGILIASALLYWWYSKH
jgi:murein DD-endopeptidase MepM/ murein hydrolase activator NlpD